MVYYEIEMQHNEETFTALARMQYDLFCRSNRVMRSVLSLACILAGLLHARDWWGILLIAYGCYLSTSTYSSSNHTARKLCQQIEASGNGFPHSRFIFDNRQMRVLSLPDRTELDPLLYDKVFRLGEDLKHFYLFRDSYGGYVIPKEALGEKAEAFRSFLMEKTGQKFHSRVAPIVRLVNRLAGR